jgi:hypothetical protein
MSLLMTPKWAMFPSCDIQTVYVQKHVLQTSHNMIHHQA